MTRHTVRLGTLREAERLAKAGYGVDDIRIKLKVSRQFAKIVVFGKYKMRKAIRRNVA